MGKIPSPLLVGCKLVRPQNQCGASSKNWKYLCCSGSHLGSPSKPLKWGLWFLVYGFCAEHCQASFQIYVNVHMCICMCIYTYTTSLCLILGQYKLMSFFEAFPNNLGVGARSPLFSFPTSYLPHPAIPHPTPTTTYGCFTLFCGYSMLYTHTWGFWAVYHQ